MTRPGRRPRRAPRRRAHASSSTAGVIFGQPARAGLQGQAAPACARSHPPRRARPTARERACARAAPRRARNSGRGWRAASFSINRCAGSHVARSCGLCRTDAAAGTTTLQRFTTDALRSCVAARHRAGAIWARTEGATRCCSPLCVLVLGRAARTCYMRLKAAPAVVQRRGALRCKAAPFCCKPRRASFAAPLLATKLEPHSAAATRSRRRRHSLLQQQQQRRPLRCAAAGCGCDLRRRALQDEDRALLRRLASVQMAAPLRTQRLRRPAGAVRLQGRAPVQRPSSSACAAACMRATAPASSRRRRRARRDTTPRPAAGHLVACCHTFRARLRRHRVAKSAPAASAVCSC